MREVGLDLEGGLVRTPLRLATREAAPALPPGAPMPAFVRGVLRSAAGAGERLALLRAAPAGRCAASAATPQRTSPS
jgi:hypothetical protein